MQDEVSETMARDFWEEFKFHDRKFKEFVKTPGRPLHECIREIIQFHDWAVQHSFHASNAAFLDELIATGGDKVRARLEAHMNQFFLDYYGEIPDPPSE